MFSKISLVWNSRDTYLIHPLVNSSIKPSLDRLLRNDFCAELRKEHSIVCGKLPNQQFAAMYAVVFRCMDKLNIYIFAQCWTGFWYTYICSLHFPTYLRCVFPLQCLRLRRWIRMLKIGEKIIFHCFTFAYITMLL